jgi:hypothetical protein
MNYTIKQRRGNKKILRTLEARNKHALERNENIVCACNL